jgi:hypothetical protein
LSLTTCCLIQLELCIIIYRVILALTFIAMPIAHGYLLFLSFVLPGHSVLSYRITANHYLVGPNPAAAKFIL